MKEPYLVKRSRRNLVHVGTTLLLLNGVVGCSADSTTAPRSIAGVYVLDSIGGHPLPMNYMATIWQATVTADTLTFNANGTYQETTHYELYAAPGVDASFYPHGSSGTYTQQDGTVTLTDGNDHTVMTSTLTSGGLTLAYVSTQPDLVGLYQKL